MPKCSVCGADVTEKPLYRTTPTGNPDPKWMCEDCKLTPPDPELTRVLDDLAGMPIRLPEFERGGKKPHNA